MQAYRVQVYMVQPGTCERFLLFEKCNNKQLNKIYLLYLYASTRDKYHKDISYTWCYHIFPCLTFFFLLFDASFSSSFKAVELEPRVTVPAQRIPKKRFYIFYGELCRTYRKMIFFFLQSTLGLKNLFLCNSL